MDIWNDCAAVVAGGLVGFADNGLKVHDTHCETHRQHGSEHLKD